MTAQQQKLVNDAIILQARQHAEVEHAADKEIRTYWAAMTQAPAAYFARMTPQERQAHTEAARLIGSYIRGETTMTARTISYTIRRYGINISRIPAVLAAEA